jgi:hypothetical protein
VRLLAEKVPDQDSITVTLRTDARDLSLLRLEAFADPSFPMGRVGLAPNGNAVLSGLSVEVSSQRNPHERKSLRFHYAWADHEQRNSDFDVLNLAKGTGEGWAVDGHGRAGPRLAVFFSDEPFGYAGGSLVTVKLDYKSVYAKHLLGKLRLTLGRTADLLKEFPLVMGDWWRSAPQKADTYKDAFDKAFGPEKQGPSFQRSRKHGWAHAPKLKDGVAHGLSGERSAFYYARSLRTPTARRVRVHLGSDDGLQVYLNGAEVYENRTQRGEAQDQYTVLLDLVAGENILLV